MAMVFSQRPHVYKAAMFLLLTSLVLYIVGFSSPYWTVYQVTISPPEVGKPDGSKGSGMAYDDPFLLLAPMGGHNGLWQTCEIEMNFGKKFCGPIAPQHGAPGWMSAVQGFQCVGLMGLLAACGYAVVVNFVQQSPDVDNHRLEILVIVSGLLGFIGSIIFMSQSSGNDDVIMSTDLMMLLSYLSNDLGPVVVDKNDLSWGFAINVVGCFLSLIASIILCAHGRLLPAPQQAPPIAVSFSTGR